MSTEELEELERIVPQDLSEWPPYAQALYLQNLRISRKVDNLCHAVEGDEGLKDQAKDHERRIQFIESVLKWAAGIGAGVVLMIATAIAQGKRLI